MPPSDDWPKNQMSKRQQKKQVLREARQERKGAKKALKQVQSLSSVLQSLDELLAAHLGSSMPRATALEKVFGATQAYEMLEMAHGPAVEEGLALLGASVVRPEKYNAKFLPQEYSLLHKIWTLLGPDSSSAGVLDIGAGNANCAVLAAALLGLTVICVERESPRIELRAEELLPPSLRAKVRRLEMDIAELDVATLKALAKEYGLQRFVLVAKHPCGIGVDRSIDCALQLVDAPEDVDLMGVVIATCCSNKLSLDDFRESRVQEFCDLNSRPLAHPPQDLVKAVELMSKCTAWRSAAQSLGNAISDEQITYAQIFEDHLQALRVQKLAQAFGAAKEVRFAPRSCTLQDRCLIGCPDLDLPSEGFLERLREGVQDFLRLNGGPMDCRRPGAQGTQVQQVRLRLLRRLLSTDPRTCAPLPSQVTSTAQTWSQRAYVTWDHDTTWSPQLDWWGFFSVESALKRRRCRCWESASGQISLALRRRFTVRDTNRGLLAGTWQEVGSDDKGAETDPKKNSFLISSVRGRGRSRSRASLSRASRGEARSRSRSGSARPRARPICFKVEQRFRALRFPEIQRTLRAALRARAGGLGLITYSKQGCHLDPPEGEPWPAPDQEDHSDRGQDEAPKADAPEAGPNAEFLVLRALGGSHAQIAELCKRADEEMIGLYCKDPAGLYLLAFSSSSSRVAEHLLEEGHGVRPSIEVTGEPAPTTLAAAGLSSLSDLHWSKGSIHLIETCAGLWVEEELHLDGGEESKPETSALRLARRIRLISRRGLLAEVHFAEPYRAVAGCLALEPATDADQVGDKVCVCRKIAVDTEPGRVATRHLSEVSKDQMLDLPDGDVPGFTWRRISQDEMPVAAAELLMEQAAGPGSKPPVCGLRAGVWIVCGDVSLQVLGPPRGEGFIGATLCMSMEQLKRIQEPQTLEEELQGRYEASTGLIVEKGCIRRDRGVGRAAEAKGPLLCGAGVNNNDPGFKTVSILYSTGLMTKGGSITLDSGTFNQVWRIRELEDNPFDSPSLRAARKVPAVGRAAGPASAVARVASSFSPKGKGKGKGKSGKGRGSRAPVSAAPARQAVPAFRAPLGSWPATRSLTVYGALPSPVVRGGALSFAPRPRLGSRPPGRPLSSLQAELHAPGRPGPPRREPAPRREPEPVRRGVTLSSGPGHRRRSRSVSRRKELRSPGYRDAPKTHGTPKFDRHRSRSNRGKRSRSRSRGGRRGARKN
ncbi:unnamed protein product [Durusdinium trenchii]|uniref:tRNA:m(4)X modification enzyme TRM13 n=1 Tax=Durusdinium trenchii TaxID=1381693 RepID=A0ABP0SVZ5_9DINO